MVPWWARFGRVPEVAPRELHERMMRGEELQIVDVRTRLEFSNGHIAGAVNVPIQSLRRELPRLRLDPSKPVIWDSSSRLNPFCSRRSWIRFPISATGPEVEAEMSPVRSSK